MVRSEPDSERRHRWTIPRWVFAVWLWLNVPASILSYYGCPWDDRRDVCEAFGNSVGLLFDLFPMSLELLPSAFLAHDLPVWIILIGLTGGCHLLLRRFAPGRLSLSQAALLVLAWYVVTFATFVLSLFVYFGLDLPGAAVRAGR
jgi:hypothetical protein